MKTRLLRKIRKRYSIVYFPDGYSCSEDGIIHYKEFLVYKKWTLQVTSYMLGYSTKEEALEYIIRDVRRNYEKYSRKYKKPNYNGIKIWYNNENNR